MPLAEVYFQLLSLVEASPAERDGATKSWKLKISFLAVASSVRSDGSGRPALTSDGTLCSARWGLTMNVASRMRLKEVLHQFQFFVEASPAERGGAIKFSRLKISFLAIGSSVRYAGCGRPGLTSDRTLCSVLEGVTINVAFLMRRRRGFLPRKL